VRILNNLKVPLIHFLLLFLLLSLYLVAICDDF